MPNKEIIQSKFQFNKYDEFLNNLNEYIDEMKHYDNFSSILAQEDVTNAISAGHITEEELKTNITNEILQNLTPMENDLQSMEDNRIEAKETALGHVENVNQIEIILQPFFDKIERSNALTGCGFIGDEYEEAKEIMCGPLLESLSIIVISMIVVGMISIPTCFISMKLVRKCYHYSKEEIRIADINWQFIHPGRRRVIAIPQQAYGY